MITAYIGIGSNLDKPLQQVNAATQSLTALPGSSLLACSPWFGSTAIGPGEQPDYVNGVAALATDLPPHELLLALQAIEQQHGRQRQTRWAARTLDLDILLYGDQCIDTPDLAIPHPRMLERPFVLQPLLAIAPDLTLPDGSQLHDHAATAGLTGVWQLESS